MLSRKTAKQTHVEAG